MDTSAGKSHEKKGWEVELGPGHWEALSGRVLSSDVNVSWEEVDLFPEKPRGRRVSVRMSG